MQAPQTAATLAVAMKVLFYAKACRVADRHQSHKAHQLPDSVKRRFQELPVDPQHQIKVYRGLARLDVLERRPRDREKAAHMIRKGQFGNAGCSTLQQFAALAA